MQERSLRDSEEDLGLKQRLVNLRFTYKKTPVALLDALTFKNPRRTTLDVTKGAGIRECLLLQTCNRTEFFAVIDKNPKNMMKATAEYWLNESRVSRRDFRGHVEESFDREALEHLLRLSAGLESMLVGEDQILGQIRESFKDSKIWGTIGPFLDLIFTKAIRAGGRIRAETDINKGAVSLGSAAVKMTERILAGLEGKEVMIIGAGGTGTLVGKALAARRHSAIYVANRTFGRAERLAKLLGGKAVRYDKIDTILPRVNVVFVATSAPHMTLKEEQVSRAMERRKRSKLLIFDLSQPRNVEPEVSLIKDVRLLDIDVLKDIATENLKARLREIENAECLVEEELESLEMVIRRRRFDPFISEICGMAEDIRQREFRKACKYLREIDGDQQAVIEKLTRVIVDKILHNPVTNLRRSAENGDVELYKAAWTLFNSKSEGGED